ncbi:MAG: PIG-L family deacetylase [Clostridia bacterium]|nr:PIG-L family deacetylase [Clostridia bacterium]
MTRRFWFLLALCLLLLGAAGAEEARDLTADCAFAAVRCKGQTEDLNDDSFASYFSLLPDGGMLEVRAAEPIGGVYIQLFSRNNRPVRYAMETEHGGQWRGVGGGGDMLAVWHPLPEPTDHFRIRCTGKNSLAVAELRVFGAGDKPAWVQDWKTAEKCDLMLLTAHPDDEILWFAGLLPTYAGERGLTVQCVILVPTGGVRRLEYLSALWHCGVTVYPEMLNFPDNNHKVPEKQYKAWYGQGTVMTKVVETVRRHRPEVIVTHGERGEYGHGAHRTAADAAKRAVAVSGRSGKHPASEKQYGLWQVKKLYLHEYPENPILCDWDQPLSAFGGKTGFEVAEEAFAFHQSQIRRGWTFTRHGEHDNAAFGLYMTTVGPDSGIGDLMEHIEDLTTDAR